MLPNGTDRLEVYERTTDWSEFFDNGHHAVSGVEGTGYFEPCDKYQFVRKKR